MPLLKFYPPSPAKTHPTFGAFCLDVMGFPLNVTQSYSLLAWRSADVATFQLQVATDFSQVRSAHALGPRHDGPGLRLRPLRDPQLPVARGRPGGGAEAPAVRRGDAGHAAAAPRINFGKLRRGVSYSVAQRFGLLVFTQLFKANRPFDLLVCKFWSIFSHGPQKVNLLVPGFLGN